MLNSWMKPIRYGIGVIVLGVAVATAMAAPCEYSVDAQGNFIGSVEGCTTGANIVLFGKQGCGGASAYNYLNWAPYDADGVYQVQRRPPGTCENNDPPWVTVASVTGTGDYLDTSQGDKKIATIPNDSFVRVGEPSDYFGPTGRYDYRVVQVYSDGSANKYTNTLSMADLGKCTDGAGPTKVFPSPIVGENTCTFKIAEAGGAGEAIYSGCSGALVFPPTNVIVTRNVNYPTFYVDINWSPPATSGAFSKLAYHLYVDGVEVAVQAASGGRSLSILMNPVPAADYVITGRTEDIYHNFSDASTPVTYTPAEFPVISGTKKLMVFLFNFTDFTSQPVSRANVITKLFGVGEPTNISSWIKEVSYDNITISGYVTDYITVPISRWAPGVCVNWDAGYSIANGAAADWCGCIGGPPALYSALNAAATASSYRPDVDCNNDGTLNDPCDMILGIVFGITAPRGYSSPMNVRGIFGSEVTGITVIANAPTVTMHELIGHHLTMWGSEGEVWTPGPLDTLSDAPPYAYPPSFNPTTQPIDWRVSSYGEIDAMGGLSGSQFHFNAWHKYVAGWLTSTNIVQAVSSGSATYDIEELEQRAGSAKKMLLVPIKRSDGSLGAGRYKTFYMVEYRTVYGYDGGTGCIGTDESPQANTCVPRQNPFDGLDFHIHYGEVGTANGFRLGTNLLLNHTHVPLSKEIVLKDQLYDADRQLCIKKLSTTGSGASKYATVGVYWGVTACP